MGQSRQGTTGIILAGGKNSRMGAEKALLKVGPSLIIERIAGVLRQLAQEIIIVTQEPEKYMQYGDRAVRDIIPGCGPLGGIYTGLLYAGYPRALVLACDTPFVSVHVGRLLIARAPGYQAVVPCYGGYLQPLCALYHRSCFQVIEHRLAAGLYKTSQLYDNIKTRVLTEEEMAVVEPLLARTFFNVNTPADLEKAHLLDKGGHQAAHIASPHVRTHRIGN